MHDSECGDGAGENSDTSVPHCHDGRDEERLVAQFGDDYNTETRNKNIKTVFWKYVYLTR